MIRLSDDTLVDAVKQGELVAGMGLADLLYLENLAYADIQLGKVVHRYHVGRDRLYGIGLAVNLFFYHGVKSSFNLGVLCLLCIGFTVGEIKKSNKSFLFNSVKEEIKSGTLLLVDKKLVNGLEELALDGLKLYYGSQ